MPSPHQIKKDIEELKAKLKELAQKSKSDAPNMPTGEDARSEEGSGSQEGSKEKD